jgi:hypothetical protein
MPDQEQANIPKTKRKRATRRETAIRDARIVRALAHGEPIDEVAAREGLTLKRARERLSAVVARRAPEPTEDFVAVQIARLNEAMLIAYGAMQDGNLAAVDRVLKITREYDRYHGLALTLARGAGSCNADAPATGAIGLPPPVAMLALVAPPMGDGDGRDRVPAPDSPSTNGRPCDRPLLGSRAD